MRKSRSDEALLKIAENVMNTVVQRAKTSNLTITQVLDRDMLLCGKVLAIFEIFLELPHLRLDSPVVDELLSLKQ